MKKSDKVMVLLLLIMAVLSTAVLLDRHFGLIGGRAAGKTDLQELVSLGFYPFSKPRSLTDTSLRDLNGKQVTLTNRHRQWQLVTFGYMFCPDICPVNLRLMADLKNTWDANHPHTPLAITSVTFDPERDIPERLSHYLNYHHPDFHGLTGELENIRELARQLNVVFVHEEADQYGNYFISHSDSIALINPDGLFVGLFKGPYEPENSRRALDMIIGVN